MKMEKWKEACSGVWKKCQKNCFFDLFSYFSTGKLLWKKMWKTKKSQFLIKDPEILNFKVKILIFTFLFHRF